MKDRCEEWLEDLLGDGCLHLCDDVRTAAKKKGFSRKQLKSAKENLGVRTHHQFDEVGQTPNWFWYTEEDHAGKGY